MVPPTKGHPSSHVTFQMHQDRKLILNCHRHERPPHPATLQIGWPHKKKITIFIQYNYKFFHTNLPTSSQIGVDPSNWSNIFVFSNFFALSNSKSVKFEHNLILKIKAKSVYNQVKDYNFFFYLYLIPFPICCESTIKYKTESQDGT